MKYPLLLLGAVFSAAIYFFYRKWQQEKRIESKKLQPNCLLTQYPILILKNENAFTRIRSWLKIKQDHKSITEIYEHLIAHGYDVFFLTNKQWRRKKSDLIQITGGAHFFFGSNAKTWITWLTRETSGSVDNQIGQSTLLRHDDLPTDHNSRFSGDESGPISHDWPHWLKSAHFIGDLTPTTCLELAISLAEQDLKCSK